MERDDMSIADMDLRKNIYRIRTALEEIAAVLKSRQGKPEKV